MSDFLRISIFRIGSDFGFLTMAKKSDRIGFRISEVGQKIRSDFGFSFLLKFRIGSDFGFAFFYKFRIRSDFRLAYFPKCSDGIGFQIFKVSKKIMIWYDFEFTIYKKSAPDCNGIGNFYDFLVRLKLRGSLPILPIHPTCFCHVITQPRSPFEPQNLYQSPPAHVLSWN